MQTSSSAPQKKARLSIAVLAFNEENRIADCLRSAEFADEIVVVDGGSSDRTVEIARELGAQVHSYPDWHGFAMQRNRLLQHVTGDYVFFLDADECISPEFQQELQKIVASGSQDIWLIRWRMIAFGQTLPSAMSRTTVERLFPRHLIDHYVGVVHEEAVLTADAIPRKTMHTLLLHHTSTDVRSGLNKMVQYAMLGAVKRKQEGRTGGIGRGIASASVAFFRLYFLRLGFTAGGAGFLFCLLKALECFFRYAALRYDYDKLRDDISR